MNETNGFDDTDAQVPWYEQPSYDLMYSPFPEKLVEMTGEERLAFWLGWVTLVAGLVITSVF